MIDYVKAELLDISPESFKANSGLDFFANVNTNTGEILGGTPKYKGISYEKAYDKNLEFRIYETGTITMSGSLHVYWNEGMHNYNDFNINSIKDVLDDLNKKYGIAPNQIKFRQIELGVNINPPIDTCDILNHCFIHRKKPFRHKSVPDEGEYIQVEHSQYYIKIYNKALHYSKKGFNVGNKPIMRFEIKYTKMEKLNKLGIRTMQDLLDYGLNNFSEILSKEWEYVLFYDRTIDSDHPRLSDYRNPLFWEEMSNRPVYYKHLRKLKELEENSDRIKERIKQLIRDKVKELTIYIKCQNLYPPISKQNIRPNNLTIINNLT